MQTVSRLIENYRLRRLDDFIGDLFAAMRR
jgi:hypothetical protein